jgi:hypothetical protein
MRRTGGGAKLCLEFSAGGSVVDGGAAAGFPPLKEEAMADFTDVVSRSPNRYGHN